MISFIVPGPPVGKGRPRFAKRGNFVDMSDADFIRSILMYDQVTGIFTWSKNARNDVSGRKAGTVCKRGYVSIGVKGRIFKAHRLAWLYVYGDWPYGQIDHIDGNKSNNKISNLRDVNQSINQQNRYREKSDNKLGVLGVSLWSDGRAGFKSQITVNGRCRYLGTFKTSEEAHEVYLKAKKQLHEGCVL